MNVAAILLAIGETETTLLLRAHIAGPSDLRAHGYAGAERLSLPALRLQFSWEDTIEGVLVARFAEAPQTVAVIIHESPKKCSKNAYRRDEVVVLPAGDEPSWAWFEYGDSSTVFVNDAGLLEAFAVADPSAAGLRAWQPPAHTLATPLPSLAPWLADENLPPWLVARTEALLEDAGTISGIVALGGLARHGSAAVGDHVRVWARHLPAADVACLDRWAEAESSLWLDQFDRFVDAPDVAAAKWLVQRRDDLASFAALRSRVSLGASVHVRLKQLDELVQPHLFLFPSAEEFGLWGDPALVAAATFDPDAWWVEFGG